MLASGCSCGHLVESGFEHDLDAAVLLVAEHVVHFWAVFEPDSVCDHETGIDLLGFDPLEQLVGPAFYVRLTHAKGQPLVHRHAEGDLVHETTVHTRDRDHPGGPAHIDHLPQHMRAVAFEHEHLLGAVEHRVGMFDGDMALHSRRIDALLRTLAVREIVQTLDNALVLEVDRNRAAGSGHR